MRTITRIQGRVPVTTGELRKRVKARGISVSGFASTVQSLRKQVFDIDTADWTADGALFYVVITHGLRTRNIVISIAKDNTSEQLFPERVNTAPGGDEDKVKIWLAEDPTCTVTII